MFQPRTCHDHGHLEAHGTKIKGLRFDVAFLSLLPSHCARGIIYELLPLISHELDDCHYA